MPSTKRAIEISIEILVVPRSLIIHLSSMAISTQTPKQIFPLARPGIVLLARESLHGYS